MLYKKSYHSPLGEMAMVSDGKGLTVLSFRGQKYDKAEEIKDTEVSLEIGDERGKAISEGRVENSACAVFDRTAEWLDSYFSGHEPNFTPPLSTKGTPFQEEVWEILKKIPYGEVTSYGEIARQIAEKRGIERMSAQAVGGAVGRNPIAIIVPCHRVVGSDGSLTGYAGGLDKKAELLRVERLNLYSLRIRMEERRMSDMKDRLHTGELYLPGDEEIMREQMVYQDKLCDYNLTKPSEMEKRAAMLKDMLGDCGEGVYIEAPFYSNFGGHHCHFGKMVYANYHLTCVDDTHIYVGDYTMFGPNVTIATAGHPILPELREQGYQYNMPVHIGRSCWIGAGVVILPGVHIGDNTVIGAGSVVTKDIPANVVAVGNPCRVMREINEHDREYYYKDRKILV